MVSSSHRITRLAARLSKALETKKRDNGQESVSLKDGSPEWMTDVIHATHGDKLPTIPSMPSLKRPPTR